MRKLTIGMVVFDDYDGLYFTIQAIRMYHREVLEDIEFVVINNNPNSKSGEASKAFVQSGWIKEPIQYFEDDNSMGTATRTKIFDYAKTPYVLVMDSHVLLEAGCLKHLIDFFDAGKDEGNLLQGPLLHDDFELAGSHFEPVWRSGMYGIWAKDERINSEESFEIPGQGLGVFACRKDSWLGFNKYHKGFGSEESTLHEKFRQAGRKTLCLSEMKWIHRFSRPNGIPYPNKYEDRVKNYFHNFLELDMPVFEIIEHFKTLGLEEKTLRDWLNQVISELHV